MRILIPLVLAFTAFGQFPSLQLPPSGGNQKAVVTQFIGPVKVAIEYSSPAVHGPDGKDRRGQIWGKLVPYGLTNLGFGSGKPGPWRAGANENTVFETSHAVLIEGKPLAAGRYGLHMIAGPHEWTVVFSRNASAWGSYFYEESEDALRVVVQPRKADYREWLTYDFVVRKGNQAKVEMQWEDLAVGWTITVNKVEEIYLSGLRHDLKSVAGFQWQGYAAAVEYCLQNKVNLEEALVWSEAAIRMPFVGQENFTTLSLRSQVLEAMGRDAESLAALKTAVEHRSASVLDIHQVGRQLLAANKPKQALEMFLINQKRNGEQWPVHVGLARGYAANGDKVNALQHAQKALAQAPDDVNRTSLSAMVKQLKEETAKK